MTKAVVQSVEGADYFILNGISRPRSYEAIGVSLLSEKKGVKIIPVKREGLTIQSTILFDEYEINGRVPISQQECISLLNEIVHKIGGGGDTAVDLAKKEDKLNKTTNINSTNIEAYPTVKTVKDYVDSLPSDSIGSIDLSSPAPTLKGKYYPTVSGTYPRFGGLVVDLSLGSVTIFFDGITTFKILVVPITLSGYAKSTEINYPSWNIAIAYPAGRKVSDGGEYWVSNAVTIAGEKPGVSSKWFRDNNYVAKMVILNHYNKNTITTDFYVNSSGVLIDDITSSTSDFIEVESLSTYYSNVNIRNICTYDINKVAITSEYVGGVTVYNTSLTARFIRVSITKSNAYTLDLRKHEVSGTLSPMSYEKTIPYSELNVDSVLVNPHINLFNNTENLASNFFSANSSLTKSSEILKYKGVDLTKVTSSNFYANLSTNFSGLTLPIFITGKKYFLSFYATALTNSERFFWMRGLNNGSSRGHSPKLLDGNVRRIWLLAEAASPTSLKILEDPTLSYTNQSSTNSIVWLFQATNFIAPDTQNLDIRIGGFQIEEVGDNMYVDGVALIGDSTMAGASGKVDSLASREVSTYASALLNVPFFNRAVGGEKTDAMDARWATDITPLAKNCKYVIIQGGINDIGNDRLLSEIKTSITSMYNKAISDGLIPILMTCTPVISIAEVPTRENDRLALNSWMKSTYPLVMDIASIIADPTNPSALRQTWSGDGTHYSISAKRAIANAIANWDFWDFRKPKQYQQVLINWTPTPEKPFVRKIGEINLIKGLDVFSNDNDVSLTGRYPLI